MAPKGPATAFRFAIRSQADVRRATLLVAALCLGGSWLITALIMAFSGINTLSGWIAAAVASTLAPLALAVPLSYHAFRLVLALSQSHREIKRLSRTDELTQTHNRRHFMELAQRELDRAARHGYPVCLLLLDLDNFKHINDNLGHMTGDRALVACAAAIRASIRQEDIVGRFGGDEFLVLAPHSDLDSGAALAHRLREAFWRTELMEEGRKVAIRASIGVVSNDGSIVDADELLRQADYALYRAKDLGGDRIELAA